MHQGTLRSASRLAASILVLAAAALRSPDQAAAQSPVEGRVLSAAGVPIPFALVTIRPARVDSATVLTDVQGRFRFASAGRLPALVRARAIGHRPDSATVAGDGAVTLTLQSLPRTINPTVVRGVQCTDADLRSGPADPAVAALLEQARLNAEQFHQLAMQSEFVIPTSHTVQITLEGGDTVSYTRDSLSGTSLAQPVYRRGEVLTRRGGRWYASIPLAAELASQAFIDSHCFVYGGDDEVSGRPVRKLLVAPSDANTNPDLEGELYLDAETYVVVRSTWRMTRLSPVRGPSSALDVDIFFARSRSGLILPLEMRVSQLLNKVRVQRERVSGRIDVYLYGEPAFARDVDADTWAKYSALVGGAPVRPPRQ
ncbi:MAG: carboxypeptidase-like regulatory domain-containing protein [Gemmatimonadaceae bacterium]|nr:carboxypeptidase-like regulatory domain-containing protein [Gemmatimonadaceae bacterium]